MHSVTIQSHQGVIEGKLYFTSQGLHPDSWLHNHAPEKKEDSEQNAAALVVRASRYDFNELRITVEALQTDAEAMHTIDGKDIRFEVTDASALPKGSTNTQSATAGLEKCATCLNRKEGCELHPTEETDFGACDYMRSIWP